MAKKHEIENEWGDFIGCLLIIFIVISSTVGFFMKSGWIGLITFIILCSLTITISMIVKDKEQQKIRKREEELIRSGIHEIDQMSGRAFEVYLAVMYKELGYKVKGTKASGDFGGDLLLYKNKQSYVVQVKRYSKKVGVRAVQEVVSGINYYNADYGWVVTNNYFTKNAIELANKSNILLVDRNRLISDIINYKDKLEEKKFET